MTVVRCPICGNSAKVDEELQGGEQLDCPYCNRTFTYGRKKGVSAPEVKHESTPPQRVNLPGAGMGTPIQHAGNTPNQANRNVPQSPARQGPFAIRQNKINAQKSLSKKPVVIGLGVALAVTIVSVGGLVCLRNKPVANSSTANLEQVDVSEDGEIYDSNDVGSLSDDTKDVNNITENQIDTGPHVTSLPVNQKEDDSMTALLRNDESDDKSDDFVEEKDPPAQEIVPRNRLIKGRNPLELFRFGDRPMKPLNEEDGRMVEYLIEDFVGIQRMILGYTKQGHLFSIHFISENDHCSVAESDARVYKFMQLCDEWYNGIKWKIDEQEHDGRKFAVGKILSTYLSYETSDALGELVTRYKDSVDMTFRIMPTRDKGNIVGLDVQLVDNKRRRVESDYISLDIRKPFKVSAAVYNETKSWLRKQLDDNALYDAQFYRYLEQTKMSGRPEDKVYTYWFELERRTINDNREIGITLKDGALETSCKISRGFADTIYLPSPIDDDYAEALIMAKIITNAWETDGINGPMRLYDDWMELPCPICHGTSAKQKHCRRCEKSGKISIDEDYFDDYKKEYNNPNAYKKYLNNTAKAVPKQKPKKAVSPGLHPKEQSLSEQFSDLYKQGVDMKKSWGKRGR